MVVIQKNGYFENGIWFNRSYEPVTVGQRIIRTKPCETKWGLDFSHCVFTRDGVAVNDTMLEYPSWVTLNKFNDDGSMDITIEGIKRIIHLDPYWNDGNWVDVGSGLCFKEDYVKEYFGKIKPIQPDGYADHLSGNWDDVPEWAIRRINFLEEMIIRNDKQRCPLMEKNCPEVPEHSCNIVKHCYPYLCTGLCGHNEIWVSDEDKKKING